MKPSDLHQKLTSLAKQFVEGCGNHGYVIKTPKGMATNGPCACRRRTIGIALFDLSNDILSDTTWNAEEKGE